MFFENNLAKHHLGKSKMRLNATIKSSLLFTVYGLVFILLASCGSNQDKSAVANGFSEKLPKMEFEKDAQGFDFGDMTEGQVVEHTFKFKNTGEFPLIINNVTASCGCTIPQWPRDPIGPDESNVIKVRFNSKGKRGPQSKTVTVYANTDPAYSEIHFTASVYPAKDSTATTKANK